MENKGATRHFQSLQTKKASNIEAKNNFVTIYVTIIESCPSKTLN
jgi:hypothetical protein